MKIATTIPTGAFGVPAHDRIVVPARRGRRVTGLGVCAVGSSVVLSGSAASDRTTGDVPTPVPVRHGGAYG